MRFSIYLFCVALVTAILSTPSAASYSGRATWYQVGWGACGGHNVNSDFVVALSPTMYNGGSHCGHTITINYGGKQTTATVVDECPSCGTNDLDMSTGLFQFFAPLSYGLIQVTWSFN